MPSFVFYHFLNSTFVFSSPKKFQPIIFSASALCAEQAGHAEQSTHPDWHNSSLYSPPPHHPPIPPLETDFRMSQAHTYTAFKPTPWSSFATQTPETQSHTYSHVDWQTGFWRRRVVKSRIDGGRQKRQQHTSLSFIFSEKWKNRKSTPRSQITTQTLLLLWRNEWNKTQSPTVLFEPQ